MYLNAISQNGKKIASVYKHKSHMIIVCVKMSVSCLYAVAQMEVESLRGLSRSENLDSKTGRNSSEVMTFQNSSATGMDQFASTARVSLKMQRVKQKLDSVLVNMLMNIFNK